jgi:hypothetical protein
MAMVAVGSAQTVAGAPGDVDTTQKNPIGLEAWFYDTVKNRAKKYVYLKGVASTVLGSWVTFDEAGVTANLATDSLPRPVAIATGATVANTYGWYGRTGHFICGAISGGDAAADARVFATSTDFLPDDVEADDMQVLNAFFVTQEGEASTDLGLDATAGLATAYINDPWFGLAVDASA